MKRRPDVTVVVPCYNEEDIIHSTHQQISQALKRLGLCYEIIYANDGSTDNTAVILSTIADGSSSTRIIGWEANRGLGAAYEELFKEARGEAVIQLDADLSISAEIIPDILEGLKEADVVVASRYRGVAAVQPLHRRVASEIYHRINRALFALQIRDTQSGFVGYRREVIEGLRIRSSRFVCHMEIMAKMAMSGKKISEIPARYVHRSEGSTFRMLQDGLPTLLGTIGLWWRIRS